MDALLAALLIVGFLAGPMKMFGGSWAAYLVPDLLAIAAILTSMRAIGPARFLGATPLSVPLGLLALYCLVQFVNPDSPLVRSAFGFRSWFLYWAFFFAGFHAAASASRVWRCYRLLIALAAVTGLYGVVQWYTGPQSFADWSEHYTRYTELRWISADGEMVFRAFSTFVGPGVFAGNMALVMSLGVAVVASSASTARQRLFVAASLAPMGLGIAVSGSRLAIVHLLLMAAAIPVLAQGQRAHLVRRALRVTVAVVVPLAVVVKLTRVGAEVGERFATLLGVGPLVEDAYGKLSSTFAQGLEWPLGQGLGYTAGVPTFVSDPYVMSLPTTNVDSGYGSAAVELGIVGLALFTLVAMATAVVGCLAWRRIPPGRLKDLLLAPAAWAVTYPVISIIVQPQGSLPYSIYFWFLIGVLLRAGQRRPTPIATVRRPIHAGRILRPALHP